MRLGLHTQYYPPEMGAPQARLSELAKRFVARGHEVHVLTAMPNYPTGKVFEGYGGLHRAEDRDGVSVHRTFIYPTKSVGLVKRLSNYFSFAGSSAAVGSVVLPKLDYLLTESPPLFLGPAGWALAKTTGARWIFNVSDLWPESAVRLGVVGQGRALKLAYALEAWCYRNAWLVTGQSREILEDIRRRFPDVPTYHLSNGVDTGYFRPERASTAVRANLLEGMPATNGRSCLAVYAGLHGIAQGLDHVLNAAARLPADSGLSLVFIGDGPEREALMEQTARLGLKNVRFLGPRPRDEVADALAAADIALVPLGLHLPGAVPSKIYEAMGSGRPVMLMAHGEARTILDDAHAGLSVEPGDVAGLADSLGRLTTDADLRTTLGANGRRAAVERFDRDAIAARFITKLEQDLD